MTGPQYVNSLSEVYTKMYNPPGKERPLTEKHSCDKEHDYDIPPWKRLLNQHAAGENFKRPPYIGHVEGREDPEESEEENSTAKLARKYVLQLIDESDTDPSAAAALADIRDLLKYG